MGLVLFALKHRVPVFVMAVLMLLGGVGSSVMTIKDVLPVVNIPVVVIVWTYTGLNTTEMASKVTTYTEFSLTDNVSSIKRIDSQTLQGQTIERVWFDDSVSIDLAISQVTSAMNAIRGVLPAGIQPPIVLQFSASAQPVIQLALSSATHSGAELYDYAEYRMRQTLSTTPGATLPQPYGGAPRQVMVDLDLHSLQANGLTPTDVVNAFAGQNVTVPSGLAKIGTIQYPIVLNGTPESFEDLNALPVKVVGGRPILVRDVAYVHNGSPPQLNYVSANNTDAVLMPIYKNGPASTLTVADAVKAALPVIQAAAPKGMQVEPLFDQSGFVTDAILDVVQEAVIAAGLTGLTILVFLGSWRSTLIVLISIPLAILTSLSVLSLLGETINTMTLGGLALAVGILVDDATVAVENTYRLMEDGRDFRRAVAEGAAGIAKPALISTLAICSAFVSVLFLNGTAKYLFTPQAYAVVFAMLASYVLSRTLVPNLIDILVAKEYRLRFGSEHGKAEAPSPAAGPPGMMARFHDAFERRFEGFRAGYAGLLRASIRHRLATLCVVGGVFAVSGVIATFVGQDYFPTIDGGSMTLHIRVPSGTRIETTEQRFAAIETVVRETIPEKIQLIMNNIGLPSSSYNFAFGDGSFVGYNDGQMLIQLKDGPRQSTSVYMRELRAKLRDAFPDTVFYFQASDMITQVLNFGTLGSIDVQVTGRHPAEDLAAARSIVDKLSAVKGAVDVHLQQIVDAPLFKSHIDRNMASEIGASASQVTNAINTSLAGSYQLNPQFWSDPKSGIPYELWVQTPEYRTDSLDKLNTTPVMVTQGQDGKPGVLTMLGSVTEMHREVEQTDVNHLDEQPVFDVVAGVQDSDLGSVANALRPIVEAEQKKLPVPDMIAIGGQIESMDSAFKNIGMGLLLALVAVYLLMTVNYESWGDPFVVLCALPLAFCGIVLSLFATHTAFSIPSLFGAIVAVGVASSNSILLVTFARDHRAETGCSAAEAAIAAGETRLRPVLMTATAMFVGMIPMAIGIGQGSEQNAALARAVLGGIAVATCSTLLFVPFLYSVLRRGRFIPPEDYL